MPLRRILQTLLFTALIFFAAVTVAYKLSAAPISQGKSAPQLLDAGGILPLEAATTTIRWAGYSTATYTGLVGGIGGLKAANKVCDNLYPGSHWATGADIMHLGTKYPWTLNAWLADMYYNGGFDCNHWTSNSSGFTGSNAGTQTIFNAGTNSGWDCSNSLYLACVYQP